MRKTSATSRSRPARAKTNDISHLERNLLTNNSVNLKCINSTVKKSYTRESPEYSLNLLWHLYTLPLYIKRDPWNLWFGVLLTVKAWWKNNVFPQLRNRTVPKVAMKNTKILKWIECRNNVIHDRNNAYTYTMVEYPCSSFNCFPAKVHKTTFLLASAKCC